MRTILSIYNNFSNIESGKFPNIKSDFICYNIYKHDNEYKINNVWDVGFLSHFYYCIGPTPLHFIFPISKYKNYTIDENCALFNKCKNPERLQITKFKYKNSDINSIINGEESSPENFINLSHKYYDDKIIT